MTPENKNINTIDFISTQEAQENATKAAAEASAESKKKARRSFGAGAIAMLTAIGIIHGAQEAPKIVDQIADIVHEQVDPSLPGDIDVTIQRGDTLSGVAEALDPSTDPREIVHELKENGVDPANIHPGETISVPVSAQAEKAYDEAHPDTPR